MDSLNYYDDMWDLNNILENKIITKVDISCHNFEYYIETAFHHLIIYFENNDTNETNKIIFHGIHDYELSDRDDYHGHEDFERLWFEKKDDLNNMVGKSISKIYLEEYMGFRRILTFYLSDGSSCEMYLCNEDGYYYMNLGIECHVNSVVTRFSMYGLETILI